MILDLQRSILICVLCKFVLLCYFDLLKTKLLKSAQIYQPFLHVFMIGRM